MKSKFFFCCLIMITMIHGSDERKTIHEDSVFIVTSKSDFTPAPNMDYHLKVMKKIVERVTTENAQVKGKDVISYPIRFSTKIMLEDRYYYGNREIGNFNFSLENDHLRSFYSHLYRLRELNEEEKIFWRKHGHPPESIFSITESEAHAKARQFLVMILSEYGIEDDIEQFDSLRIQKTERKYVVYFTAKKKNNILDPRRVYISISPDSGEIMSVSVWCLMPPYDMNYRPKINKEQVMEIIHDYFGEIDQKLGKHALFINSAPKNHDGMVWRFYDLSGSDGGIIADRLIIDCETGLILQSTFNRDHSGKTIEEIKAME